MSIVTEEQAVRSSADSGWKEILETYLPHFLEFFFPHASREIKPTRCVFKDSEFQDIAKGGATGRQYVDKLVRVSLRGGGLKWLLIHIEVQGDRDRHFEKRLFVYNNRIFDFYDREVVTMAVCADNSLTFRPGRYEFGRWGCSHRFDFPVVKLLDYRDRIDELERSDNPFAVVTL